MVRQESTIKCHIKELLSIKLHVGNMVEGVGGGGREKQQVNLL